MFDSVDAICRPPNDQEQPPRPDCIHLSKTIIDGAPKERNIILGWLFCFRTLTVSLPTDKFYSWYNEIDDIIRTNFVIKLDL